jgi:hypothetical protein
MEGLRMPCVLIGVSIQLNPTFPRPFILYQVNMQVSISLENLKI